MMKRYDVTLNTPATETRVYAVIRNIEAETEYAATEAAVLMMAVPAAWRLYNVQLSKNQL